MVNEDIITRRKRSGSGSSYPPVISRSTFDRLDRVGPILPLDGGKSLAFVRVRIDQGRVLTLAGLILSI